MADILYAPGPEFTSTVDPGLYRASFVVVPAARPAVRVTSLVAPAFGGELCRLRLEPLPSAGTEALGSFLEPARRGFVYAIPDDRGAARLSSADRAGWSYDGPSLRPRLGEIARVRVLVERARGEMGGRPLSWVAHRGLVLTGAAGEDSLFLAEPDYGEAAAFVPALGAYRALVDPGTPATPGATLRELLGHGDREDPLDVVVEMEEALPSPD